MKPLVDLDNKTVVIGGWVFTFSLSNSGDNWIVKGSFNGSMKATDFDDIESITQHARDAWEKALNNS